MSSSSPRQIWRDFGGVGCASSVTPGVTITRKFSLDASRQNCFGAGMGELVLSIFPGIDLLGRGFEAEGFCVVRGPDLLFGGDIRDFHPPPGKFSGVIGGPPCQNFSMANPRRDPAEGMKLVTEFLRCVAECAAPWFLMENTPGVPDVAPAGYVMQRFFLNAAECGGRQFRNRRFQFGSRDGFPLVCDRGVTARGPLARACLASEGSHPVRSAWRKETRRRGWAEFCELQGLPPGFELPDMSMAARYRAVGNGVPVYMAATIARAIRRRGEFAGARLCACGCGRALSGAQLAASAACRKRLERARRGVTAAESDTPAASRVA